MTVFVYINTSKQVGDADYIKVFANVDAAEKWFEENDQKALLSNMRFWSEPALAAGPPTRWLVMGDAAREIHPRG